MNLAISGMSLPLPVGPEVEVIADGDALLRLQPEWDALLEDAGVEHPFLTHEWVRTWWECFGGGKQLHLVTVRDRGRLVGLLPLMRSRERRYGLRVRRLGSLYNPHVPRAGCVVAPGVDGVPAAIWRHLLDCRQDWDVLELCPVAEPSAPLEELRRLAEADGCRTGTWTARPSPYLPIRGSWEEYFGGLRAKHRSNLRNRAKRLGQQGEVGLERVTRLQGLGAALEDGFRIEAAAWKEQAGSAIDSRPELRRFYTRLAECMAPRGWLQLQFLTLDGQRIAFGYTLHYRNRLYLLKPGYDPAFAPYSPGNLLLERVLQEAFARGLAEHDFLGVDDAWKQDWTPQARPHHWLHIFPRTARGELLHAIKFRIAPAIRRWAA